MRIPRIDDLERALVQKVEGLTPSAFWSCPMQISPPARALRHRRKMSHSRYPHTVDDDISEYVVPKQICGFADRLVGIRADAAQSIVVAKPDNGFEQRVTLG